MKRAYIVGGGVSGLACGELLARQGFGVTVFEASGRLGGMAATFALGDFRFDMGPHKLYSPMVEPMDHVRALFPETDQLLSVTKVSQLHFQSRAFAYPLSIAELLRGLSMGRAAAYGASFVAARLRRSDRSSYARFMRHQFGGLLYDEVFGPAALKVFGADEELSARLGEARFAGKSFTTFIAQALRPRRRIDAPTFLYPRAGTGEVPARLRQRIEAAGGRVACGSPVTAIECAGSRAVALSSGGERIELGADDLIVYTAPLRHAPALFGIVDDEAHRGAAELRYRGLLLVYVTLRKESVMAPQWVFYPTSEISFNRLSEPRNFSPAMAPPGHTSLVAEVTIDDATPHAEHPRLAERAIADLVALGLVTRAEVIDVHTEYLDTGYPVWLTGFERSREAVFAAIDRLRNVYPLGRQGLYQYVGILDCVDMARRTARFIESGVTHEGWTYLRQELQGYPVID